MPSWIVIVCRTELFVCLFVLSWEVFESTSAISFLISKKGKDWIPLGSWSKCDFPAISGKSDLTLSEDGMTTVWLNDLN